ncbi:hypothetical protein AAF712_009625 [Marasmius tenuissimus]|uniref:FAR-17a/AIG1-like protein n=1 Tax=Marasmius tenuissimus TaxID=585030 RepID=A0ABR2ZQS5_9AGAR
MTTTAQLFGAAAPFDPTYKLVTSPFFSPVILASIRALIAFYTMVTLIVILAYDEVKSKAGGENFAYFTYLTYTGICAYYWASFVQTVSFIRSRYKRYALQRWGKTLQVLHLMLQTTVINFPIIVTIAFWALISSPTSLSTPVLRWRNISVHALNSAFCIFEVLFTNNPPPQWIFLPFMILLIGLYTAYAYVMHATQGFYPYEFLDPSVYHGRVAMYVAGIVIGEVVIFMVVWGLMKLRERIWPVRKDERAMVEREMREHGRGAV